MKRQYESLEPSFGISKKLVVTGIIVAFLFVITFSMLVGVNKTGNITVVQYPWGTAKVISSSGFYFKPFGKSVVYKKTDTFTFSVPVRFNDGFPDNIKAKTTYTLPVLNDEQFLKLHYAHQNQEGLIERFQTITRFVISLKAVTVSTEESRSEGFKEKFEKRVQEELNSHGFGAIRVEVIE